MKIKFKYEDGQKETKMNKRVGVQFRCPDGHDLGMFSCSYYDDKGNWHKDRDEKGGVTMQCPVCKRFVYIANQAILHEAGDVNEVVEALPVNAP